MAIGAVLLTFFVWRSFGTGPAVIMAVGLASGGGGLGVLTIYRQMIRLLGRNKSQIEHAIRAEKGNCYRQLEALLSIRAELGQLGTLPPMRGWAISPDFGELILEQLRETRAERVLECGCGVSTLIMGSYFRQRGEGRVVSLEHDPVFAERWSQRIRNQGLEEFVSILYAPLVDHEIDGAKWKWYDLANLDGDAIFDFAVVDGPPGGTQSLARYPFFKLIGDRLYKNAVVLLDDSDRPDEKRILAQWKENGEVRYYEKIATEKGAAIIISAPFDEGDR